MTMRTLGFVLAVLLVVCLTNTDGALWGKTQTFFKSLKHILGHQIEKDGSCGKSRPRLLRWWRTRMKDGNVDGVPENADNEAYLGALNCRIWLSVCNLETNPDNGNPWRQIKRQLWSLKRLIWKSDRVNIAGGRRNWARWWLATYRDTRAAAKADLAGKCAEWREKCNAEDGDPTDPGPDDGDSEEEMSDEVTDNTSPTVPTSPSALTDVNVDRLHEE